HLLPLSRLVCGSLLGGLDAPPGQRRKRKTLQTSGHGRANCPQGRRGGASFRAGNDCLPEQEITEESVRSQLSQRIVLKQHIVCKYPGFVRGVLLFASRGVRKLAECHTPIIASQHSQNDLHSYMVVGH